MVQLLIEKMEKYAIDNDIPIMEKEGIQFLLEFIKENKIKSILEIGSAIGYSAIKMALLDKDIKITTIEIDKKRHSEAVFNISEAKLGNRIKLVLGDALTTEIDREYDLIFIDAAKSQYIKFFEKYKVNLKPKGFIFSDNLNFHGYTKMQERIQSKNLRQLVTKIRKYIVFLESNEEFNTTFYEVGDGISISSYK